MEPDLSQQTSGPTPGGRSNVGLWAGIGCLGAIVLSCCLLSYWVQAYGFQWVLSQDEEMRSYASRVVTSGALQGITATCVDGLPAEDAEIWFHPDATRATRTTACGIDEVTLQEISTPERAASRTLIESEEQELAARYGMDPALCYRYMAEAVSVVGCFDTGPDAGSIPYKIIDAHTSTEPAAPATPSAPTQ
ncbi:MAG: hypothetical protein AAF436_16380 [Myxococcota bacterium]